MEFHRVGLQLSLMCKLRSKPPAIEFVGTPDDGPGIRARFR